MERGHEIKILDHGYIRLVDFMGSDEAIVEDARMSTGRGFVSWEPYARCKKCGYVHHYRIPDGLCGAGVGNPLVRCSSTVFEKFPRGDLGLLTTMFRDRHMTPFETGGELKVEVQAPIMVFREWHRHRTQAYNELSARYTQMPDIHYVPALERIQKQSTTNKQGSGEAFAEDEAKRVRSAIVAEQRAVYANYEAWLGEGVAKEIARIDTPVSRYSRMRAKTDLRNWFGFLSLRKHMAAQWEIRQYADAVGDVVQALWPRAYDLFLEYEFHAVRLSRSEAADLRAEIARLRTLERAVRADASVAGGALTALVEHDDAERDRDPARRRAIDTKLGIAG